MSSPAGRRGNGGGPGVRAMDRPPYLVRLARAYLQRRHGRNLLMSRGWHTLRRWLVLGILIGVVSGLAAIALHLAIQALTEFLLGGIPGFLPPRPIGEGTPVAQGPARPWLIPLVTTLGGLLSGLLTWRLSPEAQGSGQGAVIRAYHQDDGDIRARVPFVKLAATAITLGSGGSGGREGPMAHIGAGLAASVARALHLGRVDRRIAVVAGFGAGVGAIFKAPLGGAILAAEILYLEGMEVEALMPAFIATIVAFSIFTAWAGFTPVFGVQAHIGFEGPSSLLFFAALGLACGLVGILYIAALRRAQTLFHRIPGPFPLKPALGGLLVGLIALALPQVMGMGYGWVQQAMQPAGLTLTLMLGILAGKIVATALTVGSGASGGVFGPGIVIGGFVGAVMWQLLHPVWAATPDAPAAAVLVGMMALFGAIGHAPLAVMVMVAEMAGSYALLPAAMVAVGVAYVIVGRKTIFPEQVENPAHSPTHRAEYSYPLLNRMHVREAMREHVLKVHPETPVAEAAQVMLERQIKGLPVVNGEGRLVGIVANIDVVQVPRDRWRQVQVGEIMSTDLIVAHADDALDYALGLMRQYGIGRLPVVDPAAPDRLVGIITTSDIVEAYFRVQRGWSAQ